MLLGIYNGYSIASPLRPLNPMYLMSNSDDTVSSTAQTYPEPKYSNNPEYVIGFAFILTIWLYLKGRKGK